MYPARFGSRVELHLRNGEVKKAATLDPHGTAADPCTEQELVAKFVRLVTLSNSRVDARGVVDAVSRLEVSDSIHELPRVLRR